MSFPRFLLPTFPAVSERAAPAATRTRASWRQVDRETSRHDTEHRGVRSRALGHLG
jgi:hypothetical protein